MWKIRSADMASPSKATILFLDWSEISLSTFDQKDILCPEGFESRSKQSGCGFSRIAPVSHQTVAKPPLFKCSEPLLRLRRYHVHTVNHIYAYNPCWYRLTVARRLQISAKGGLFPLTVLIKASAPERPRALFQEP